MGRSKLRKRGVGECIYCGSKTDLTKEHVLPYALGGNIVINEGSCKPCALITGKLEQRLLRGHWWPYRKKLGLQTRSPSAQNVQKPITITKSNGDVIEGLMPLDSFVAVMVFHFDPPSIITGEERSGEPFAKNASMKMLGPNPSEAIVNEKRYLLSPFDKVTFPINFDSGELTRFLAKVAHGYAISREGLGAFERLYLPKYILGQTDGIQTYVGGYKSPMLTSFLPGGGCNRMMLRTRGDFTTVCIQLFIDNDQPPPIYEVVVGKKHT